MNIDLKQKLTSRKLWSAIIAVIVAVLSVIFQNKLTPQCADILSMSYNVLCVYILGESAVDVSRNIKDKITKKSDNT